MQLNYVNHLDLLECCCVILASIHFDDEALVFYGKIEFIRALVTYEATNARGLRKAFEEAVNDYFQTCQDQNISPETPFKGSLNIRIGPDLHRRVALSAEHHHLTINKFITQILDRAVGE